MGNTVLRRGRPLGRLMMVTAALGLAVPALVAGGPIASPPGQEEIAGAIELLPEAYRPACQASLVAAGPNAGELIGAIRAVPVEQREGVAFLLANMPPRDLETLSSAFLVENVTLAYQVRDEVPWGRALPGEVFLNYVLPYVNLNERRDRWRADFRQRFLETARACGSIQSTALRLNHDVFQNLEVSYHASKRPKPDQSPYESIEAGYASCTGLSILYADALRSVGIPCRVTGTPLWVDKTGNHTWVEIWDDGTWHHVGAAEPAPFDQAWFNGKAARADASTPEHWIYAASFKRTGLLFPLVWDRSIDDVHAENVTARYTDRKAPAPPDLGELATRLDPAGDPQAIREISLTFAASLRPSTGTRELVSDDGRIHVIIGAHGSGRDPDGASIEMVARGSLVCLAVAGDGAAGNDGAGGRGGDVRFVGETTATVILLGGSGGRGANTASDAVGPGGCGGTGGAGGAVDATDAVTGSCFIWGGAGGEGGTGRPGGDGGPGGHVTSPRLRAAADGQCFVNGQPIP